MDRALELSTRQQEVAEKLGIPLSVAAEYNLYLFPIDCLETPQLHLHIGVDRYGDSLIWVQVDENLKVTITESSVMLVYKTVEVTLARTWHSVRVNVWRS